MGTSARPNSSNVFPSSTRRKVLLSWRDNYSLVQKYIFSIFFEKITRHFLIPLEHGVLYLIRGDDHRENDSIILFYSTR